MLEQEYDEPYEELFERIEPEAFAAASIGQVHRGTLHDGREVAVKIQYPGIDAAIRADLSNAGMILRLTKALAPGLDAKAVADELRERVLEELDYEYEAQNQRTLRARLPGPSVHLRARRRHAPLAQPRARHRVRRGSGLRGGASSWTQEERNRFGEIVFRFYLGSIYQLQHFNADAHPGNYLLTGRRPGRVPRLRHDEAPRPRADPPRGGGREGAARPRPRAPAREAARPRLPTQPEADRRRAADGARGRGRRLVPARTASARSLPST